MTSKLELKNGILNGGSKIGDIVPIMNNSGEVVFQKIVSEDKTEDVPLDEIFQDMNINTEKELSPEINDIDFSDYF